MAFGRGEFEPPPALGAARRHAFALKVAKSDAIFGGRQPGLRGAGDEPKTSFPIT